MESSTRSEDLAVRHPDLRFVDCPVLAVYLRHYRRPGRNVPRLKPILEQRVATTYLQPAMASTAVVTNSGQVEATADLRGALGMTLEEL